MTPLSCKKCTYVIHNITLLYNSAFSKKMNNWGGFSQKMWITYITSINRFSLLCPQVHPSLSLSLCLLHLFAWLSVCPSDFLPMCFSPYLSFQLFKQPSHVAYFLIYICFLLQVQPFPIYVKPWLLSIETNNQSHIATHETICQRYCNE